MLNVKVCGLVDPVNTQEIVEALPDFIGFNFYPGSKRYVGDNPHNSLFSNIPATIRKTGIFVNENPGKIIETTQKYNLNLIQLHGNESAAYCRELAEKGLKIIKAFGIGDNFNFSQLTEFEAVCEYFLFDTKIGKQGGSGLKFKWEKIHEYYIEKHFFLAGGIKPADALSIKQIKHKYLFAVDINSCFELFPGIKDPVKVKKFIDEIKG
jgi:phosphoribosylanthranilate isomerase